MQTVPSRTNTLLAITIGSALLAALSACVGSGHGSDEASRTATALAPAAAPPGSSAPAAEQGGVVRWHGELTAGAHVSVRSINGTIRIEPSADDQVALTATKHGPDRDRARVVVNPTSDRLTVCVRYDDDSSCQRPSPPRRSDERDARVDIELRLPPGMQLEAKTINGAITSPVAARSLDVTTVNGVIELRAAPRTRASTVNGKLRVSAEALTGSGADISLRAVNGAIDLSLPRDLDADISAATLQGSISSDLGLLHARQRFVGDSATGRIGNGGGSIELDTVNGPIHIALLD